MGIWGGAHFNPGQVTLSSEWGCGWCPWDKQQQLWGQEQAGEHLAWGGGAFSGARQSRQCQPGRLPQLAGPEKLPVKPQPFETLTNKVFFSFEVE